MIGMQQCPIKNTRMLRARTRQHTRKVCRIVNSYCAIIFRQYLSPLCFIWELDRMQHSTFALLTWRSSVGFLVFCADFQSYVWECGTKYVFQWHGLN